MALELKQIVQPDYSTDYLWVTNKTGEYVAGDNEGGFGGPNALLSNSALGVIVIARDEARTIFENISPRWKHDANANDGDETLFQIKYEKDAIVDVYMVRLLVSGDGQITIDGITLTDGYYYYDYLDENVKKIENGVPVVVEDMRELIDNLADIKVIDNNETTSLLCSDCYVLKLTVEYAKEYKAYTVKRKEGCDNLKEIFFKMLNFKEDIIGARRSYNSGLFTETQSIIDTLYREKNLQ